MARKSPVLPGQSRSVACRRTKGCARLDGHRKACRATLTRASAPVAVPAKASAKSPTVLERTVAVGNESWLITVLADGTVTSTPIVAVRQYRQAASRKPRQARSGAFPGVETLSADRYTVLPERQPRAARKPRKAAAQCRVSRDGIRCPRPLGHKAAGQRHAFPGRVTVLPEAGTPATQPIKVRRSRTVRPVSDPTGNTAVRNA